MAERDELYRRAERILGQAFGGTVRLGDGALVAERDHFPTCWCVNRIPRETVQRVENTYRAALVAGCPAAADDAQFGPAVVAACAYWVIDLLNWAIERPNWYESPQPLARAGRWGIATIQQRMLVRAELLTQTIAEYPYFEAIGAAIQHIAAVLRTHWPASAGEMPFYPAFRDVASERGPGAAV